MSLYSYSESKDKVDSDSPINQNQTENPTGVQASAWKKNSRYYLSLVTFRVGGQLFRVPRNGFEMHSEVFRGMFISNTSSEDGPQRQDGDTDDDPIHLESINEGTFEDFLQLLYPEHPTDYNEGLLSRPSNEDPTERWINVLDLAHMWQFHNIKQHCASRLDTFKFDEVRKTEIAHKYEIKSWYMPSYIALANRQDPLSIEEAWRLGLEFTVKMGHVREMRINRQSTSRYLSYNQEVENYIKATFDIDDDTTEPEAPSEELVEAAVY